MKEQLTQSRLKELLHYDPETGIFTRRVGRGPSKAGARVGSRNSCGYIQITIDYRNYHAHRLAFLYMTGALPEQQVDHINGVRNDNRWANLRDVSANCNHRNIGGPMKNNTSGFLGVCWDKNWNSWKASITVARRSVNLGRFPTPELAHTAYLKAKDKLHPTHLRLREAA